MSSDAPSPGGPTQSGNSQDGAEALAATTRDESGSIAPAGTSAADTQTASSSPVTDDGASTSSDAASSANHESMTDTKTSDPSMTEPQAAGTPSELPTSNETPAGEVASETSATSGEPSTDATAATPAAAAETAAAPVADAPAAEAAAPAPSETPAAPIEAAPSAEDATATPERSVKLEPTGGDSARAVPSLGGESTGDGPMEPAPPVEVPQDAELGESLEAEIAAAMSQELAPPPVTAPTPDAENVEVPVEEITEESLEPGTRLKGEVQSVDADNVFVEVGLRAPGLIQARQFESGKLPEVGATIDVVVDRFDEAEGLVHLNIPRGRRKVSGNWDSVTVGQVVDCMVTKSNKGGLEVSISNLRGFLPAGQVDLGYIADLEPYVGQKLTVQIIEVNPKKRNLVVSRRALLQEERKEAEAGFWEEAEIGSTHSGRVKTIKDYGAFVDIGGVDGFLHIGEISWSRIKHPTEVIQVGDTIDVKILSLDRDKNRIGLGMKQMGQNPWNSATERFEIGNPVTGKVTRTTDFGAFIEIEPGVEGLVHISELDYRRVNRVTDVLNVGQEVEVKVLEVDPQRRRIGLSLKQMSAAPEREPKPRDEDNAPSKGEAYTRKRKGPLRGGYGGGDGGGLFGNPSDFTG